MDNKNGMVRQWIAHNASEEGINKIIDPESKGKAQKKPEVTKEKARTEFFRLAAFMGTHK